MATKLIISAILFVSLIIVYCYLSAVSYRRDKRDKVARSPILGFISLFILISSILLCLSMWEAFAEM